MARHIPAVGACKVAGPEWPGSALAWSDRVNRAGFALPIFPQKNAVVGVHILDNRPAKPHPSEKLFLQLAGCDIKELRYKPDFSPAHPYISLRRPGAAIPALQAPEMQPRRIPIVFIIVIHAFILPQSTRSFKWSPVLAGLRTQRKKIKYEIRNTKPLAESRFGETKQTRMFKIRISKPRWAGNVSCFGHSVIRI
jgi:hypothetical protein